jgi:hypothetical protein
MPWSFRSGKLTGDVVTEVEGGWAPALAVVVGLGLLADAFATAAAGSVGGWDDAAAGLAAGELAGVPVDDVVAEAVLGVSSEAEAGVTAWDEWGGRATGTVVSGFSSAED